MAYELRYEVVEGLVRASIVGGRSLELELGDHDFFDLGYSPLFNSLPVRRDRLERAGAAREYVMAWIDVPTLDVSRSEQRYEPLRPGLVRFSSGSFSTDIELDEEGLVVRYPDLAERVA